MKSNLFIQYCPYCSHKLIRKQLEGRNRLFCPNCKKIYYENPTPVVAVVARDKTGKVLLIKRKIEPCKGEWALPSGFMEIEETPVQAALRELKEETSVTGKAKKLIGVYSNKSNIHGYLVTIIYEVEIVNGAPCAGDDAEEAKLYDVEELPCIAFESQQKALSKVLE